MTLTIELPKDLEAALEAQARAQGITAGGYVQRVLQKALSEENGQKLKATKSAYGILAQYGPGPSEQDIDENRREMFRVAEDAP